jgi:hypothetical protein
LQNQFRNPHAARPAHWSSDPDRVHADGLTVVAKYRTFSETFRNVH